MNKESFCFSNLGWVRKVYIILMWFFTLVVIGFLFNEFLSDKEDSSSLGLFLFSFVILTGFSAWKHFTIVKRKSIQLGVVAVLSLFTFNILSFIALLIFADVSKKEQVALIASK